MNESTLLFYNPRGFYHNGSCLVIPALFLFEWEVLNALRWGNGKHRDIGMRPATYGLYHKARGWEATMMQRPLSCDSVYVM